MRNKGPAVEVEYIHLHKTREPPLCVVYFVIDHMGILIPEASSSSQLYLPTCLPLSLSLQTKTLLIMFKFDFGVVSTRSKSAAFTLTISSRPQDEDDQDGEVRVGETSAAEDASNGETSAHAARYRTISLDELVSYLSSIFFSTDLGIVRQIEKLPPMISFSEMELPFETTGCKLYRRDLYDARFQVIDEMDDNEEEEDSPSKSVLEQEDQETSKYVNADTDLIPGTYEGGLKTWEGGMDLVEILEDQHHRITGGLGSWVKGKRVLEVSISPYSRLCGG